MRYLLRSMLFSWPLLVIALSVGGCGGGSKKSKIWVYQYPSFYQPSLRRVAVLPFRDPPGGRGVGRRISDRVSTLLTNNRTYEVYTRAHLKDILAERDLADAGIIDSDIAMEIGRVKSVQALICGVCNRYQTTTKSETRYNNVPIWGKNKKGYPVITGWRKVPYRWTRHDGFVECNVVVIDTKTGRQIAAVNDPSNMWAYGSPPQRGPAELIRLAEEDEAVRIAGAIAVTRKRIKLKGKVLRIATGLYDQKWDWEDRIASADRTFLVVVILPPEASRNNFKITIIPKGERKNVAEQKFVWSGQYGRKGYTFKVGPIVEQNGFGEYQVKLYSGPEPIARYGFKIVESR